jgi:hypothetical protein
MARGAGRQILAGRGDRLDLIQWCPALRSHHRSGVGGINKIATGRSNVGSFAKQRIGLIEFQFGGLRLGGGWTYRQHFWLRGLLVEFFVSGFLRHVFPSVSIIYLGGGVAAAVHYIGHVKVTEVMSKGGPIVSDSGLVILAQYRSPGRILLGGVTQRANTIPTKGPTSRVATILVTLAATTTTMQAYSAPGRHVPG